MVTSYIVYREVLQNYKYIINNICLVKYFIFRTCELFAQIQVITQILLLLGFFFTALNCVGKKNM